MIAIHMTHLKQLTTLAPSLSLILMIIPRGQTHAHCYIIYYSLVPYGIFGNIVTEETKAPNFVQSFLST